MPEKIIEKSPNDGLGGQTDEEKMGVKYSEIAEMIETGRTNEDSKEIILKMYRKSRHKRREIPVYKIKRKNYLQEIEES